MAAASPITIGDNQNVDIAVTFKDAAGVPVPPSAIDAGSLTGVFADGTEFTVTPSADQSSVNVKANGEVVSADTLTVNATVNGVALADPGTIDINVVAGPAVSVLLTPGTPVNN